MKAILTRLLILPILLTACTELYANPADKNIEPINNNDTASPVCPVSTLSVKGLIKLQATAISFKDSLLNPPQNIKEDEQEIADLELLEKGYTKNANNSKAMLRLLRIMKVKRAFRSKKYKTRLFTDLANISAKLKLYPLAMQYHYETMALDTNESNFAVDDTSYSNLSLMNERLTDGDISEAGAPAASNPVSTEKILESFEDGKISTSYALILHIKQPVAGKRKAFTGIDNVGHMFITLIKYNSDQTFVSRSFGFYPQKINFFAATPLHPAAPPVFKDDALHEWDEAIGKFISYRRFTRIIKLLIKYEYKMYHLNQNNCTDFGLTIASISGISIKDTKGKWPLGKGNNPANAGQSILEGKFNDDDREDQNELFIFNTVKTLAGKQ